jgi:hypothetical protein
VGRWPALDLTLKGKKRRGNGSWAAAERKRAKLRWRAREKKKGGGNGETSWEDVGPRELGCGLENKGKGRERGLKSFFFKFLFKLLKI